MKIFFGIIRAVYLALVIGLLLTIAYPEAPYWVYILCGGIAGLASNSFDNENN